MRGLLACCGGRFLPLIAAGAAALVVAAGGDANPAPPDVAKLRAQADTLASRGHQALLDLYSAETRLSAASTRLASLHQEIARVREQRALVASEAAVAARVQRVTAGRLAAHLKVLYEQGQPDPLALILGSSSLDEALSNIESLNRVAAQDRAVVHGAIEARERLEALSGRLAARSSQLETAEQQAAASVGALERARAQRSSLLASLRSQQRLTRGRIATLDAAARAAQAKTIELTRDATPAADDEGSPPDAGATDPAASTPAAPSAPAGDGRTITVLATGYSLPGRTATGLPVGWGVAAVDASVIPLGTHMTVPGYGEAVAADTGGGVRGAMIDLWFPTLGQARAWGRRTVTITLH